MSVSCDSTRTVEVDGQLYLLPKGVQTTYKGQSSRVEAFARFRSCTVNGTKISLKFISVSFSKTGINMENLMVMKALNAALVPMSGPSQSKIHIVCAARIMEKFDLEYPDSGILDTDTVTVKSKRHMYVRESTFLAGQLRQLDVVVELTSLAALLSKDTAVTSATLTPGQQRRPCKGDGTAAERALLDPGVAGKKKTRPRSTAPRSVTVEDGTSWMLPKSIYLIPRPAGHGLHTLRLSVILHSCQVNGKGVRRALDIFSTRPDISKRTLLALRATRDALFPVSEPGRCQVHRLVAALALRSFDKENPESNILDDTVVTVRIPRHGYVKESSYAAGDLRVLGQQDIANMTELFLNDPEAMSGELERIYPSPSAERADQDSADNPLVSCKRSGEFEEKAAKPSQELDTRSPAREPACSSDVATAGETPRPSEHGLSRVGGVGAMDALSLPSDIFLDAEDAGDSKTLRLKMRLGPLWVNGEECVSREKTRIIGGVTLNSRNIVALRSLRDDIALGLGASPQVRLIIAAKAFRSWQRERSLSSIPDGTVVNISDAGGMAATASPRPRVVSTAGKLRGVYTDRQRVFRDLLRGLGGTQPESQPEVAVPDVEDRPDVELSGGSAALVEGTRSGKGSFCTTPQRPIKRRVRSDGDPRKECSEEARVDKQEAKRQKIVEGEVRPHRTTSSGDEGGKVEGSMRHPEREVIDLVSDPSVTKVKKKKKKKNKKKNKEKKKKPERERGHAAVRGGKQGRVPVGEGASNSTSTSADGSPGCCMRGEGGTSQVSPPGSFPLQPRKRGNGSRQQPDCSLDRTLLTSPMKRPKTVKKVEAGKGSDGSGIAGRTSSVSAVREDSRRKSRTGTAEAGGRVVPAGASEKESDSGRSETQSTREDSLLADGSARLLVVGQTSGEGTKREECVIESKTGSGRRRSIAPEGGSRRRASPIGEQVLVDLTADPPSRRIRRKTGKKLNGGEQRSCQPAASSTKKVETLNGKGGLVTRIIDGSGWQEGSTTKDRLLPVRRREATTPRFDRDKAVDQSRKKKLMDWIANG